MTTLPETETLILKLDQGWLTIWFNTPENRNALSDKLAGELKETLLAVREDRSVRGITLRGKGGIFCAGGDLKGFMKALSGGMSRDEAAAMNRGGGELFALVNAMPQVVVVLVEGAAIAGGLGLVCCADIVVVTKDAKFSLTETQIGIPPAQIAPYIVQRLGLSTARRLMLTGARFDGEEAGKLGLADHVVAAADDFDDVEINIRKNVIRCAPGANAITKEIVLASQTLSGTEMMDFAAERFAQCITGDEGREGIASFVEKRKPEWAE